MNRSTMMTILRFSIVIMLMALAMFFWLDIRDPGFVAICITMVFYSLIFFFGMIRLILDEEQSVEKKKAMIFLVVYVAVCVAAIAVKFIVSGIV